ncbi:beta-ketoacyl reductase [Streptomyces microflavus]|uniref:beta-ketoacyl reductase n=1 Tax=Streptomyces microflavus TaxID=1919 RepID=UPI0033D17198
MPSRCSNPARISPTGRGDPQRIVVNARSAPGEHALGILAELSAQGKDVVVVRGDITEPATAERLVAAATATGLPLRGVVHAAAVVEDAALVNIEDALLDRNWGPKVLGGWHLHHASQGQPLDWFCCFSSGAALLGSAGQGAYAAANSWLDALTVWRRAQGLPGLSVAWGAWAEVGRGAFLGEDGDTTMITPQEGVYAFDQLLRHRRGYTGYLPTQGAPWVRALAERSPFAADFSAEEGKAVSQGAVLTALLDSAPGDQPGFLRTYLCSQVAVIMRVSAVDPGRAFTDYGLDSLGKLELRTRIVQDLGLRVPTKVLWAHDTAQALAAHLLERIVTELADPSGATA